MDPKYKNSDTDNLHMLKRSYKVLPLNKSENSRPNKERKKVMLRLLRSMVEQSFICEIVKKKKINLC